MLQQLVGPLYEFRQRKFRREVMHPFVLLMNLGKELACPPGMPLDPHQIVLSQLHPGSCEFNQSLQEIGQRASSPCGMPE